MAQADGFAKQTLHVLARSTVAAGLDRPITRRLMVTDAGHFPEAAGHGRSRRTGSEQVIVIVCSKGSGWVQLGNAPRSVRAGEAVVIPARTPHSYGAADGDPWSIWWFHVEGIDVDELASAVLGPEPDPIVEVRDLYAAIALMQRVVDATGRDETQANLYDASGAAFGLLTQLAADRMRGAAPTTDRIQAAQDHLRSNLADPITVGGLARLAGLSVSHFSALFKQSTGVSVLNYLRDVRSARARELLLTTDHTVAEIARSVGYDDAFYFSRQFRAVNGVSPTAYRSAFRAHSL